MIYNVQFIIDVVHSFHLFGLLCFIVEEGAEIAVSIRMLVGIPLAVAKKC